MKFLVLNCSLLVLVLQSAAQVSADKKAYTRADSLRGNLTPLRTCYDINYYHLNVQVDVDKKLISGSNLFKFTAMQDFNRLQVDLFDNLRIDKIIYKGKELPYKREFNAVFVSFPAQIRKGVKDQFTVFYSGNPIIAKNAPWDGGLVDSTDGRGKPWLATACQGLGASVWWPNKDHQSDEVDSMLISVSVPKGLKNISNGRLRKVTELKNGFTRFDWFVSNPINNYGVALNIGDYAQISDVYQGENGKLTLDYWVLSQNIEKAKKHFAENVKPMLKAFEHWFGPYPFYEDGYKLVETPHLGMEHQSATAYGNKYQNGYRGRDLSGTGLGLDWDFIIIHESGHEWFGNNITSKDIADMWIHESFTNYSESLFIEHQKNKLAGQTYVHGTRKNIQNDEPIIGDYNVNARGSGDMYYKGGNLLNMVRTIINDDAKWRQILRGLNAVFGHKTITASQMINYINQQCGINLTKVFDQYLRYKNIPVIEVRFEKDKLHYRWVADVDGFDMPIPVRIKNNAYQVIKPTTTFQVMDMPGVSKDNFEIDQFNFYVGLMMN